MPKNFKKLQKPTICNTGKRSAKDYVFLTNSVVLILKMPFILHLSIFGSAGGLKWPEISFFEISSHFGHDFMAKA